MVTLLFDKVSPFVHVNSGQLQWTFIIHSTTYWRLRIFRLSWRSCVCIRPVWTDGLRCSIHCVIIRKYNCSYNETIQSAAGRDVWMWQNGWSRLASVHWAGWYAFYLVTVSSLWFPESASNDSFWLRFAYVSVYQAMSTEWKWVQCDAELPLENSWPHLMKRIVRRRWRRARWDDE